MWNPQRDQPVAIVADDREHDPDVVDCLRNLTAVCVRIERLRLGDYLVNGMMLFERKTLLDFARSIVDGRLFKQMTRLANSKHKAVLILEGTGRDVESLGVRREAMQGALITISLILGLSVLRSMSAGETARLIVYPARQMRSLGKAAYQRHGYRPRTKRGRQLYILQGLPGVGPERALRLLENFGSVEAVMCASRDDLIAVEGVGTKTADRIRWSVNEATESYDAKAEPSIWPL